MPRSFQSADSVVASKRIKRGKSTAGTKNYSTVSTKGSKPRYLTVGGTPTTTRPTSRKKATRQAESVRSALSRVRKSFKSRDLPGVEGEAERVARTLLNQGDKVGASKKLKTAAIATGLVESGLRELDYGDADSQNWRQERAQGYADDWAKTGGPNNTKASARRFYSEAKGFDAKGKSAGEVAADTQRPAEQYRGRYAERDPDARAIVRAHSSKAKVKPKDKKILRKAGLSPRPTKGAKAPGKKPFKKAAAKKAPNPAKVIDPKWDPDDGHTETKLAKGISPVVKKWSKKFGATIGAGYDPGGGHVSPGHNEQGTATDVYPKGDAWDDPKALARFEKGLKVLDDAGFEVGYGTDGIGLAWENHGRGNHAHIEWVGQGSSDDAVKKLAGLSNADIAKIEAGGGGAAFTTSGAGGGSTSSGGSASGGTPAKSGTKLTATQKRKQRLARVREAFPEATEDEADNSWASLRKKYAAVV